MNWYVNEFNIRVWRMVNNYQLNKAPSLTMIYGLKGLGKSAMLLNLHRKIGPQQSILTEAASFARQYAYAAQENKLNQFRQRYRSSQLILFDDLQLLTGKLKTIEELYYTYESVIGRGGKMVIVLQSDSPNLEFLGERLASRFLGGVIIPIERPSLSEIKDFLDAHIHHKCLYIDERVKDLIAEAYDNLADVKRVLEDFKSFAELHQDELSLSCFKEYLVNAEYQKNTAVEPLNVIRLVSQTLGIPLEDLVGPSQKIKINEARQLAIYIIRTICQLSYPDIAHYFNRNHNTMITAYQKMHEKLAKDPELKRKYEIILNVFQENRKE